MRYLISLLLLNCTEAPIHFKSGDIITVTETTTSIFQKCGNKAILMGIHDSNFLDSSRYYYKYLGCNRKNSEPVETINKLNGK